MNSNMPPSKDVGLARFACTHCRQKKIKAEPAKKAATILPQNTSNVDQRLSRVEKALDTLSDVINTSLISSAGNRGVSEAPSSTTRSNVEAATSYRTPIGEEDAPELTLDHSHSFSYLSEASRHLDVIKNMSRQGRLAEHQAASSALQDLSKSLTTVSLQQPRTDAAAFESLNGYYVPSRAAGYNLISYFLQSAQLADILFITPLDDLLLNVIFDPATVPQRAWIVYVNFILLTLLQNDSSQSDVVESLQKNTEMALNDCRIFLEPSEINVQALLLLGCHGEQYASPNLSWMLVGHACRQAQALGLHVNVPLPDFQYLLGYHPHRSQPIVTENGSSTSTFGAHFFIQGMKLAKLTGAALSLLASPGNIADYQALAAKLRSWDSYTNELLLKVLNEESATSTAHQIQEMTIGVRAMRFQYLHILVLVLRKDPSSRERRVQAARDAIMLLPDLVSNSIHVYNGLVWQVPWQLLYYPFTPFFTLFGHIMDHPSEPSTPQDLELLQKTATYFKSMKQFGSLPAVSSKLEKTALVFCNLADFAISGEHTAEDAQDQQSTATGTSSEESMMPATASEESTVCGMDTSSSEADFELYTNAFMAYIRDQDLNEQSGFDNIDIENILGCLDSDGPSPRKRKRSFDNTMDWFSWDTYYCKE
ncbi:uncharacterized protein Triagg1_3415 [Trichoderma aggressivum f. europaeum]|uniref:Transcription factor domain-containing protein n=1 Tax=Trichoderma aggressivum f. europaeum TaxID=173218 RepID=A0AAE1II87_9HYPO|nr:hypothetical protein Triagg1_3415 [Trichoderma aggressivum f. europaeum]